ncbi:hypothetical protein [Lyngbya aestuarii]|uniref:hypothetical protein n=1 Tax=Lyngbya aestuarii TaxID=118322 RepID=UPI00403D7CEE
MLVWKKNSAHVKNLMTATVAGALVACNPGAEKSQVITTPPTSVSPTPTQTTDAPATSVPTKVTIPGVPDIGEVRFKPLNEITAPHGFLGTVNGSAELSHNNISKTQPVELTGWAILPDKVKPGDMVFITYGENNSLLAATPVNVERPDVVEALGNPAYLKSGWVTNFDPSALPTDKVALKAWVYDATSQEATLLSNTHEIAFVN